MVLTTELKTQIKSDVKDDLEALYLYCNIGTDNTIPAASDTALGAEVYRKAIDSFTKNANSVTASAIFLTTEGNGNTIKETGWITANTNSVDDCETADWTDSADMTSSVNAVTYKEGTKALDITKDAGASATASTYKATTSNSFTDKIFFMWVYIKDATMYGKLATTDCLTIRFGSNSSNYYQYTQDKADLAVGWNAIYFTIDTADSTTGSPVDASCDYTYVGITATGAAITWSAGDLIMDDIKLLDGTLNNRDLVIPINKTSDINLYVDTTIEITVTES